MPNKPDVKPPKRLYLFILLIPVFMFGVLGAFMGFLGDSSNPLSGFLWGIGIGVAVFAVCGAGMFIWEWIKKEVDKGKLLPYLLIGFAVAVAISGYLALNLGSPTCEEYSEEPQSSCVSYADDGFEVTGEQQWEKFWSTLPITAVIAGLVAALVHSKAQKRE